MAFLSREFARVWLMPVTLWLLLAPALWLAWQWIALLLGWPSAIDPFNPIQDTHHFLGETAIRVLLAALAVTPFRDVTGWAPIMRVRRRVGLAAFFYVLLHVTVYVSLDLYFSLEKLWDDVVERTYITFGMLALALLIPLAITSHNALIKRLGAARWRRLHWLIYPIGALAIVHHSFAEKGAQLGPWIHGGVLAGLLGWRLAKVVGAVQPRNRLRHDPAGTRRPREIS